MIPRKFTITGSHGVQAGLGRESLTVDLEALVPTDATTIAIKGDNGAGKSTIMNLAMVPWREPPHLVGTLYDEFADRGKRELEWTHDGRTYLSTIDIRQTAKTKAQKATLHYWSNDEWAPVATASGMISDGKVSTYDECLEWVLGPQSLYYLAAFRAQNAVKLADYKDPKSLMNDLLSLDEPAQLRDDAKAVARDLKREYEFLRTDYEDLAKCAEQAAAIQQDGTVTELSLTQSRVELEAAEQELQQARAKELSLAAADIDMEEIRIARAALEARIVDERRTLSESKTWFSEQYASLNRRKEDVNNRHVQRADSLRADARRNNKSIADAEKYITHKDAIEAAEFDVATLTGAMDAANEKVKEANEYAQAVNVQRQVVLDLGVTGRQADQALDIAIDRYNDFERRAAFVAEVPCGGTGEFATCPALKESIRARESMPEAQAAVNVAGVAQSQALDSLADAERELQVMIETLPRLEVARSEAKHIITQLASARQTASLRPTLDQSAGIIKQAEEAIKLIMEDLAGLDEQLALDIANIEQEINSSVAAGVAAEGRLDATITALQTELNAMPEPEPESVMEAARVRVSQAEKARSRSSQMVASIEATLAESQARIKTLTDQIEAGADLKRKGEMLTDEIAHWALLALALQGVIDLTIEDAGPTISAQANDLLTQAYGPRFSLSIITQRKQANGRLVEDFDIQVIDGESGQVSSVLHKSGGESVWLDKALTDAVGLYHQDNSGSSYECLFADESEDGLTADRKDMFYRMDRAALEQGGYQQKFFISHHPASWELADVVIDIGEWRE